MTLCGLVIYGETIDLLLFARVKIMKLTGAQAIVKALELEGVDVVLAIRSCHLSVL